MSLRRLLIHRCTAITPDKKIGETEYGKPIYGDKKILDVPCRADQIKQAVTSDTYGSDIVSKNVLFVGPSHDFTEMTRFTDVRDQQGNPVLQGEFGIESSKPAYGRRSLHHYEITLQKESGKNG